MLKLKFIKRLKTSPITNSEETLIREINKHKSPIVYYIAFISPRATTIHIIFNTLLYFSVHTLLESSSDEQLVYHLSILATYQSDNNKYWFWTSKITIQKRITRRQFLIKIRKIHFFRWYLKPSLCKLYTKSYFMAIRVIYRQNILQKIKEQ